MPTVGWVDTVDVHARWKGAPEDVALTPLLQVAYELCVEYVDGDVPTPLPERLKEAQFLLAKSLHESPWATTDDGFGGQGLSIRRSPMDATIRGLLRPRNGVGYVG